MNGNDTESNIKQKRSSQGASSDAKSRNWRFLFDNLKRAVGYIYSMCEQDGDIEECKEAIMVLHNRIKEFEGLIQYIEVQASYETSEERPSSVAWEVPVSAIKQPSLPFQPNGEQLYYYPCLPQVNQTYSGYSMPGTFPMIDPNVVNYMSFNQPFAGFSPDFNGQPPPAPQQYQHFGFTDYNNNNNGSNAHNKKSYSKHRRSGSKHDNYKQRTSDIHSTKKIPASSINNLNSLDITPAQIESADGKSVENASVTKNSRIPPTEQQEIELSTTANITSNSVETQPESSIESAVKINNNEICSDGKRSTNSEHEIYGVSNVCDLKHTDSHDSVAVHHEISEAINDRSSVDDEPSASREEVTDGKNDWTVVDSSSDNFVHVNSDGSDHSLSVSPEQPGRQSVFSTEADEEKINQTEENNLPTSNALSNVIEESNASSMLMKESSSEKETDDHNDSDEKIENSPKEMIEIPPVDCKIVKGTELKGIDPKDESKEISACSKSVNVYADDHKEDSLTNKEKAPSDEIDAMGQECTPLDLVFEQKSTIVEMQNSSSDNSNITVEEKISEPATDKPDKKAELDIEADSVHIAQNTGNKSAEIKKQSNDVENNENSKNVDFVCKSDVQATKKEKQNSTVRPNHSRKASNNVSNEEKKPADRGLKLSCSSEVVDIEGKEVDVLSESGLSTMSSGSVQSSMSLPPNPLARSTSWADLVRTGKSESPVPPPVYKNPYSSKYQSTPSRYLNHRQAGSTSKYGPNSRNSNQPAASLSKSKSLPNQRGLQTNRIIKSKESHVTEDGWSVSSGKSRVKTIPTSCKNQESSIINQPRSNDAGKTSATSPKLSLKSSVNSSTSRLKSNDSGSKIKSADGPEKPKASRGIKPKPATTPSTKNVAAKVNSKPSNPSKSSTRTSRPLTVATRGGSSSGKPSSNKRLVKAKSLESTTKLADNLKLPSNKDSQKNISKSSETLEKSSSTGIKTNEFDTNDITKSADSTSKVVSSITSSIENTPKAVKDSSLSVDQKPDSSLILSETDSSSGVRVAESTDDTDAEGSKAPSESKSIQTDVSEQAFEDHVEIFAVPASSMYPKLEDEENCNIYRVMISKRKRQISEQSSISTDTLDEDEKVCLSPGRSPGRSPSSRSSGGGRSPGKAPQLHQRLSSPSRKRNNTDAVLKNYTERLAKAQVQRDKIQEEKANKLKKIKIKEEQIKDLQEQQEKERVARAISHAEKLARAEQLRDKKIAEVKRKAQEEDQKVNEIAFINTLEAQNRKMELLSKEQMAEAKRAEIQEERKRRSEELQAKEDAVQERKLAIEADRLARIAHIEDKIKESQAKVDLNKLEMEIAAKEAAKERALERELTIELVKKDRSNSTDCKTKSKNRQQTSKLKEMQQKAAMLCQHVSSEYLPTHTLYQPPKWCSKCNIKIVSEAVLMAHMIKRHQKTNQDEAEVEGQYIVDYTDELCPMAQDVINRQKMLRKRSKKVKTRIVHKVAELPAIKLLEAPKDCPNKNRLFKCIKAMKNEKTQEKGLGDLSRTVLTKTDINHLIDKGVVEQLCQMVSERNFLAPLSKLLLQCSVLSSTGSQICVRWLPDLVDSLHSPTCLTSPVVYSDLLKLISTLLRSLTPCDGLTSDIISYIVSKEIIEKIQITCTDTYNYQLKDDTECSVLLSSLQLLSSCCVSMTTPNAPISISPTKNDPSQLVDALVFTRVCNIVTLLYGVLLYEGSRRTPSPLSEMTRRVVKQCFETLLHISRFSLHTLQSVMDSEGMSLELRHVCSFVLSCASHHNYTEILDLCVQLIGFVVFQNPANQALLQNGPSPSILQLLSSLPFSYFSDVRSMNLLFPSLISACHSCPSNLAILQQKVNKVMLISYLKEQLKESKEKHINFYPRTVLQQALKFLETPEIEVT
ncbi:hypothetical protein ACHWQZ_G003059 [Mnemiopsis leidyi]